MFKGKGFTLVELLVVLIIIGVLVAIAVPAGFRAITQANRRECAANIRSLNTAINMFYSENNRVWPTTIAQLNTYVSGGVAPTSCHVAIAPATGTAYAIAVNATTGESEISPAAHAAGTNGH